jgi:hypothetical protein
MSNLDFLIVRFTHGAAGKFLSTVLQTSELVDHWSAIIQQEKKTSSNVDLLTLEYIRRSFPKNLKYHLMNEPMAPYNSDLYSCGFERGNDVSLKDLIEHATRVNDNRLLSLLGTNIRCNLIFHKPNVPEFCKRADVVTILVETKQEQEWLKKTLWNKHFVETNREIRYIPNDPKLCNFKSLPTILKFQNEYKFDLVQKDEVYEKYVVNDHTNKQYFDRNNFTEPNNHFINLRDFFSKIDFLNSVQRIFQYFNLGNVNIELVSTMYDIWWSRQYDY